LKIANRIKIDYYGIIRMKATWELDFLFTMSNDTASYE